MAAASYTQSPRHTTDKDFEESDMYDMNDDMSFDDPLTDEATDDASETELARKEEFTEIKEQLYMDQRALLKKHAQQLDERIYPEYLKKLRRLEQDRLNRLENNEMWKESEEKKVEDDYEQEKKLSVKEFESKKIELKESLIAELIDKKRHIEQERGSIELTGSYFLDAMELKPASTRKLRRRANDPIPVPEKRRKPSPDLLSLLTYTIDEDDAEHDVKILNKVSGKPLARKIPVSTPPPTKNELFHARIEDGRLLYEKKWFTRNQPVFVESSEMGRVGAVISAVGTQEVWCRRTSDNSKLRIYTTQLQKGKYLIRKRS